MTDLPRHDAGAEDALIGQALIRPEAIDDASWFLQPEHFWDDRNRQIWGALVALRASSEPTDPIAVASYLNARKLLDRAGGSVRLAELMDFPALGNPEDLGETIQNWARIRAAQSAFRRLAVEARTAPIPDPDAWLDAAQAVAIEATAPARRAADTSGTYAQLVEGTIEAAQAAARGPGYQGFPTGLKRLDEHTGGLGLGQFWVVGARPGQGKTALVQQFCEATARCDALAIVFELEMSKVELGQRALARKARYPLSNIRSGRIAAERWSDLTEAGAALARLPIVVDDEQALTPARIRSKLRRHVAEARRRWGDLKLGLVVVDHVQLTKPDRPAPSLREALTETSAALKAIAKEFATCVVGLSQLNRPERGVKVRPPTLVDLRETGALEQDADTVLLIHREDEYLPPAERTGHAELILAKGRHSGSAHFTARFDGRYQLFWDDEEGDNRDDD